MTFQVRLNPEARAQRLRLAPIPKRRVNEQIRALERDPYGSNSRRLEMKATDIVYRVRAGRYRVLFNPGPGEDEITVFRIALREVAYEGFEHPDSRS